jgi:phenylpropionate dioxygenase-like ring-hydroxylating dioxygenase large terminal subunit
MNINNLIENFWHLGCHNYELATEGDYIKFQFLGRDVVLYNDGASIVAFDNICPHRGAKFFTENAGNSLAVCKYHGWTISKNLLIIPSPENYSFCPETYGKYKIDYCGSFVFFAINPQKMLIEQLTEPVFDYLEAVSFDSAYLADCNRYKYQSSAFVAVENALEPDHVPFIHRDTLYGLQLADCRNEFFGQNSVVKFNIGNLQVKKGLDRLSKIFNTGLQRFDGYLSLHIYPFSFISSTCGYSYSLQNFFPLSENESDFCSRLYFPDLIDEKKKDAASYLYESIAKVNRKVFSEDHEICRRINFQTWLKMFDGPLSISEEKLKNFRQNIRKDCR